ncbi:hypothetical protein [Streptomyces mirabilis]|uniref:hypothetical protein n=1 Tax=Streptomyces mirabilis TaxID=68239 RepID=UPI0036B83334
MTEETFGGALPSGITAHPKVDPLTGEPEVFCYGLLAVAHRQRVRLPTGRAAAAWHEP